MCYLRRCHPSVYPRSICIGGKDRPVAISAGLIISDQKIFNSTAFKSNEVCLHTIVDGHTPVEKHYLCHGEREGTIPTSSQAVVLVLRCSAGLMRVQVHQIIFERRCFMTARVLMGILSHHPFAAYIANLMAKPVHLAEFTMIVLASNDSSCVIPSRADEPCVTESRGQTFMQCYSSSSVHAIHYRPPGSRDEQVDQHNAVKFSDCNENLNWQLELQVPNEYVAYRHKFVPILSQFARMWDGHLQSIETAEHRVNLEKSKDRGIHSPPYRAGPKVTELEKLEIKGMLVVDNIEPAKTQGRPQSCLHQRKMACFASESTT